MPSSFWQTQLTRLHSVIKGLNDIGNVRKNIKKWATDDFSWCDLGCFIYPFIYVHCSTSIDRDTNDPSLPLPPRLTTWLILCF